MEVKRCLFYRARVHVSCKGAWGLTKMCNFPGGSVRRRERVRVSLEQPKVSAALVAAASKGLAISQEDIGVWSRWSPRTSLRIVASVT